MYTSFYPGKVWLDTNGKRIHAHGGSIFVEDGIYYWYGENKEFTDPDKNIWHWGVRCYASTDLYNWEDKGLIIPPEPDDPKSSLHPSACMDRPHILYNQRTGKYVCWLKIMEKDGTQSETVLTSDHLLGPYTKIREGLRPLGMSAGDFDLAVAPDGKGYYFFERNIQSVLSLQDEIEGNWHNIHIHCVINSVDMHTGLKITNTRSLFEHLLSMLAYEYPYLKMDNYVTYE